MLELTPGLSPSVLDRAVADAPDDRSPAATAEAVLTHCGLSPRVIAGLKASDRMLPGTVLLGMGARLVQVVTPAPRRRLTLLEIDVADGSVTQSRHRPRSLARRIGDADTVWLHVSKRGALSQLAAPGATMRPWRRLWGLVRLERRDIVVTAIYAASVGVLTLLTPIATQALVNTIAFGTVLQPLIVLSLALLIGLSLAGSLAVLQAYIVEVLQRRILVRVAEDFGERLPRVTAAERDRRNLVELNNRFFDVVTVQKASAELLLSGLSLLLQISVGLVLLGVYHPVLLAFDLVLLACLFAVLQTGRGATATAIVESKTKYAIAEWLDELARSPMLFAGGHGRLVAAEKLSHRVRSYVRARRSHFRRVFSVLIGGVALQVVSIVALLGIGGWLVIERQLTLGQLVAAEIVVGAIAFGIGKMGRLAEKTFDLVAAVDKIGAVLDLPATPLGSDPLPPDDPRGIRLTATELSVGYARDDSVALDFDIAPGTKLLVDAPAASGASALMEVLAGWRRASSGKLRWDGHSRPRADDIAQRTLLVRGSTVVAQTIFANLRLANSALSTKQAWNALTRVGLSEAIDALPLGLDTPVLPNGSPLSASQLRRLGLARALIAQPGLLLIDEALDFLSDDEEEVDALCDVFVGDNAPWTALVISNDPRVQHQLSGRFSFEQSAHSTNSREGSDETAA